MLKRLDCRKEDLDDNRINFVNIYNQPPKHITFVNVKIVAEIIWKRYI